MAATRSDISRWFDYGVQKGATHMVVLCDTYDYDDYPVYVMPVDDVETVISANVGYQKMCRFMECYRLDMNKDAQLNEHRANHREYPEGFVRHA